MIIDQILPSKPPHIPHSNMKIVVWPTILEFFYILSQKSIRTTQQNSHQTCNVVEMSPFDPF